MRLNSSSKTFLLSFALLLLPRAAIRAEAPPLLDTAFQKLLADEDHWAYTQIIRRSYKVKRETVERFDPSKPDDQQWTLVQFDGKAPTEPQLKSWQKRKQKEVRRREEKSLGDLINLSDAKLYGETGDIATYEVPLQKDEKNRFPPEKFLVLMSVDKKRQELEHVNVTLRQSQSFRMKGVANVDSVAIEAAFKTIDEKYAPQPTCITASGSGKVLGLFKVGQSAEITWTDHRRVKPYKDRFDVKLGDLKALDF